MRSYHIISEVVADYQKISNILYSIGKNTQKFKVSANERGEF